MKTTSNKDMLNAIRNQASAEYQERIPAVTSDDGIQVAGIKDKLFEYPSVKNEFINTLVNKVVRTDFFSKVYENPLKMLKKGSLPYGGSIEELFVLAAEAKGFFTNGSILDETPSMTDQDIKDGLLNKETPNVKALYITKNFAHYFKTSISDAQLKAAFTSQNGLSELVNQIVGSLTSGAEQTEFKNMKELLNTVALAGMVKDTAGLINGRVSLPTELGKAQITQAKTKNGVKQVMRLERIDEPVDPAGANIKDKGKALSRKIRSLAGRMKFVSKKYNMAGVDTWCNPEDLVFLTTPEVIAEMDVDVLADAFNVSKAELNVRIILVDELPKYFAKGQQDTTAASERIGYYTTEYRNAVQANITNPSAETKFTQPADVECLGILMDKNFLQVIDTVNEARTFENGRSLTTNMFLHKQGMLANCFFANAVAIVGTTDQNKGKIDPENF